MGLAKWDITIDMTTGKIKFNNFFEEGERETIKKQSGPNECRLLQKYKGIRFYDEEEEVAFKIIDTNVKWKNDIPCNCVLAKPVNAADDDDSDLDVLSYQ